MNRADIDAALARRLVASQFAQWAELPSESHEALQLTPDSWPRSGRGGILAANGIGRHS